MFLVGLFFGSRFKVQEGSKRCGKMSSDRALFRVVFFVFYVLPFVLRFSEMCAAEKQGGGEKLKKYIYFYY